MSLVHKNSQPIFSVTIFVKAAKDCVMIAFEVQEAFWRSNVSSDLPHVNQSNYEFFTWSCNTGASPQASAINPEDCFDQTFIMHQRK